MILFGFKGCGKTHFGKLLSVRINQPFIDSDQLIEEQYAKDFDERLNCRHISLKIGEDAFRAIERRVILGLKKQHGIIAVGGGAVLDQINVKKLSTLGQLLYLKTEKSILKQRIFQAGIPSFLDPQDPETAFERMYEERKSLYEKIEALHIDMADKNASDIIDEILGLLRISHGQ